MKLVVAIMQDNDASRLTNALGEADFRTTKLSTTGGFLKKGNTTLMIGCKEEETNDVLKIIKKYCSGKENMAEPDYPMRASTDLFTMRPIEIGGATVFVLPVDQFHRF